jgi:hypothetical protein
VRFPHVRCHNIYATLEVEADSIDRALQLAKTLVNDEPAEPCDGRSYDWNEFLVCADNSDEYLRYYEPALAAEIAAQEMLEALRLCEEVLSDLARLDDGTPSVSALHMARAAIAKAAGQEERVP